MLFLLSFTAQSDIAPGFYDLKATLTANEVTEIPGGGQIQVVPVPAAAWLMGSALLALVGVRRRLTA